MFPSFLPRREKNTISSSGCSRRTRNSAPSHHTRQPPSHQQHHNPNTRRVTTRSTSTHLQCFPDPSHFYTMAPPPSTGLALPDVPTITTTNINSIAQMAGALHSREHTHSPIAWPGPAAEYIPVDSNVVYRTSYTAVSLLCMVILALMLGKFRLYKHVMGGLRC